VYGSKTAETQAEVAKKIRKLSALCASAAKITLFASGSSGLGRYREAMKRDISIVRLNQYLPNYLPDVEEMNDDPAAGC